MDYSELVRRANRFGPIDPVMDAYQKAAPALGESASGQALPSPPDSVFLHALMRRGGMIMPPLMGTSMNDLRQRMFGQMLPKVSASDSPPEVRTGLPHTMREAPSKQEYQMLAPRHY